MELYTWLLLGPRLVAVPAHALIRNFFVAVGVVALVWPVTVFCWIAFVTDQHINLGFLPLGGTMVAVMAMPTTVLRGCCSPG